MSREPRIKRASSVCAAAAAGFIATAAVGFIATAAVGFIATAAAGFIAAMPALALAQPAPPSDTAPAEDIRDIRGPKTLFPWGLMLELLAGGVVLAAGGYV